MADRKRKGREVFTSCLYNSFLINRKGNPTKMATNKRVNIQCAGFESPVGFRNGWQTQVGTNQATSARLPFFAWLFFKVKGLRTANPAIIRGVSFCLQLTQHILHGNQQIISVRTPRKRY